MSVTERVKDVIRKNAKEINVKRKKYDELQGKVQELRAAQAKGYNNAGEINRVLNECTNLNIEIKSQAAKARKEAEELCDKEINRLYALDMPKAAELSDDAELLKSGISLSKSELEFIANKAENKNHTMNRLIYQYAKSNGIELSYEARALADHSEEMAGVNSLKESCSIFEKWLIDGRAENNIDDVL